MTECPECGSDDPNWKRCNGARTCGAAQLLDAIYGEGNWSYDPDAA